MSEKENDGENPILCKYDFINKVAIVTINRPKNLNALNTKVIISLGNLLDEIELMSKIRSVIIIGSGNKAFVAGADIKEFASFNKKQALDLSKRGKRGLFHKIKNFSKPIIAAINGYALGGGLELALSCHIRLATINSKLGLPECSLGLIPGYSGTQLLPQIIGKNLAMEMILTGKMIDAESAFRIGLINYNVLEKDLMTKSLEIANSFKKSSPEAIKAAIKSINFCYSEGGDALESNEFSDLFETKNFKEGVAAFLEKRQANFN